MPITADNARKAPRFVYLFPMVGSACWCGEFEQRTEQDEKGGN